MDNVNPWLPWKFIGHGNYGSCSHQALKEHTTLQEWIAFCTRKRQDSGATWNGLYWYAPSGVCACMENETGHHEDKNYLHFKV